MASFRVLLLYLAAFLLFEPSILAQKISFEGGLTLGVNGIDIRGEKERFWGDDYDRSGILGITAGPFVRCNFSPGTYGVIELRYIQKGTTFGFINDYFTQSFETIRLNYIEMPVLFGSECSAILNNGNLDFFFETGFAFSRMFTSRLSYYDLTKRWNTPSTSGFKNYDLSWVAQLKFPYKLRRTEHLLIGLRMERSISSIHDTYKLYNFDYGIELNYLFN